MAKIPNRNKEQQARDFIASNFEEFSSFIVNRETFPEELNKIGESIYQQEDFGLSEILQLLIIEKLETALPVVASLKLLAVEYQLLATPKGIGKQPSVDIMAYDNSSGTMALIELKVSDSAEREAITELGAYSQGLQNRFNGLTNLQILWMPVSTEWRTTTESSLAYFMAWQKKLAMPLKMQIEWDDNNNKLNNLKLEFFNPVKQITEIDSRCLLSYECFDTFDYCTMKEIKNRPAFINYITSLCGNYNINGFVIFHKPVDLMYPYGFTLCIYNAYYGSLHKHMSNYIANEFGLKDYGKALSQCQIIDPNYYDVDLETNELKFWDMEPYLDKNESLPGYATWDNQDFIPLSEMADTEDETNTRFLIKHLKKAIDGIEENPRAFGTPDFYGTIKQLKTKHVDAVSYFGLHHEIASRHIMLEQKQEKIETDFFDLMSSFSYLKKMLKKFNSYP